jgi:hypothetical protein
MRFTAIFLPFITLLLFSCGRGARNAAGQPIADSSMQKGKELAAVYCQSCHILPDPSLLNKVSWERGVMPAMGPRLGIFHFERSSYPSDAFDPAVGKGFYPSRPLLTDWEWRDVINYYSGMAPDSMPSQPEHDPIDTELKQFRPVEARAGAGTPLTAFVKIDTMHGRQVIGASLFPGVIRRWGAGVRLMDTMPQRGEIVDMEFYGDTGVACNIGNINPNNGRSGTVNRVWYDKDSRLQMDTAAFLRDLARPVQVSPTDLNGDGVRDYLVCEFGNLKGALSWMEGTVGGGFVRHVLRAQPGAIKAYIRDANGDGLPDIWVLFAQGDEGVFLYINKGKGQFEERRVLSFPPVYGSSYFELADMNGDGFPDIVYTCGDNADYSLVLKPYHGVYIYLNDGHDRFRQSFFYPVNGCYKAMARDFDGDGDLDLAVIAAFADFRNHPEEGFAYLENKGGMSFKPYSLPAGKVGRWLTMDVGDVNGDGRPDVVLGNFAAGPALSKGRVDWRKGPALLVLMNINR